MSHETAAPLPAVDYLKIPEDGAPYLAGCRCEACGAVFVGAREVCARCAARGRMAPIRLADTGTLYTYAIVHRSFPGTDVPFISAIVDLDGGGTVKGNLMDVDPDPANIEFGMPVQVVYRDALGRKDKDGRSYLSYFFVPRS
jgi:uncharacterized protein